MADPVVGSEGWEIDDILLIIKDAPIRNFASLADNKWTSLASPLKVDRATVKELQGKLRDDKINLEGALYGVLESWMNNAADDATVGVLAGVLEKQGLKTYANALRKKCVPSTTTPQPPQQQQPGSSSTTTANDPDALKNFIRGNLPALLERTMVYSGVIAYLYSVEVFGEDDDAHLKSISNEPERTKEFYKIIQKKRPDCYNHLLVAFKEQSGVLEILRKFEN